MSHDCTCKERQSLSLSSAFPSPVPPSLLVSLFLYHRNCRFSSAAGTSNPQSPQLISLQWAWVLQPNRIPSGACSPHGGERTAQMRSNWEMPQHKQNLLRLTETVTKREWKTPGEGRGRREVIRGGKSCIGPFHAPAGQWMQLWMSEEDTLHPTTC